LWVLPSYILWFVFVIKQRYRLPDDA
jgi:hypothetical protein